MRLSKLPLNDRLKVCLDFSNTQDWHGSDHPIEKLNHYTDLIHWSQEEGITNCSTTRSLLRIGEKDPSKANLTLEEARSLRESIYHVFSQISHHRKPPQKDLALLNQNVSKALSKLELICSENKRKIVRPSVFLWHWKGHIGNDPDQILWATSISAANLLVSTQLAQVKECANESEGCGWLFIDESKSHSRRWCSMNSCGNRSKVRRFYNRQKLLRGKSV